MLHEVDLELGDIHVFRKLDRIARFLEALLSLMRVDLIVFLPEVLTLCYCSLVLQALLSLMQVDLIVFLPAVLMLCYYFRESKLILLRDGTLAVRHS